MPLLHAASGVGIAAARRRSAKLVAMAKDDFAMTPRELDGG